jgi:hypothetical protein
LPFTNWKVEGTVDNFYAIVRILVIILIFLNKNDGDADKWRYRVREVQLKLSRGIKTADYPAE